MRDERALLVCTACIAFIVGFFMAQHDDVQTRAKSNMGTLRPGEPQSTRLRGVIREVDPAARALGVDLSDPYQTGRTLPTRISYEDASMERLQSGARVATELSARDVGAHVHVIIDRKSGELRAQAVYLP